jgi:hypothetical protein
MYADRWYVPQSHFCACTRNLPGMAPQHIRVVGEVLNFLHQFDR